MTQEEAKKWKNEIAAFAEGKTIQYKDFFCKEWTDNDEPNFKLDCFYRIKPEPTKRQPTIEEVKEWFMENMVFVYKDNQILHRIQGIDIRSYRVDNVFIGGNWRTIEGFCIQYTHADGSELYITE